MEFAYSSSPPVNGTTTDEDDDSDAAASGGGGGGHEPVLIGDKLAALSASWAPDLGAIRLDVVHDGLADSPIRSLYWRIFLEVVDGAAADGWADQLANHRVAYAELLERTTSNPTESTSGEDVDLTINNPLSTNDDSPWSQFFQDSELEKMIQLDLIRTHPTSEFFQKAVNQERMRNILFVWAKNNPSISYRQGMNELLSVILLVIDRDTQHSSNDPLVQKLFDCQHVEHDSYIVFARIMRQMECLFRLQSSSDHPDLVSPIVSRSNFIQNELLNSIDHELCAHLARVDVHPQLYLLRWIRLLFAREFPIDRVMVLWDGILSRWVPPIDENHAPIAGFPFAEHISAAMLLFVRQSLIQSDNTACLKRLLNFPPVEDMQILVQRAAAIESGELFGLKNNGILEESIDVPQFAVAIESPRVESAMSIPLFRPGTYTDSITNILKPLATSLRSLSPGPVVRQPRSRQPQQSSKRHGSNLNTRLGHALASIISEMQSELRKGRESCDHESLLQGLARIKMVKDVLVGLLPIDSLVESRDDPMISQIKLESARSLSGSDHQSEMQHPLA